MRPKYCVSNGAWSKPPSYDNGTRSLGRSILGRLIWHLRRQQLVARTQPALEMPLRRVRMLAQQLVGGRARGFEQVEVAVEIREPQQRHTALARAQQFSRAPELQIAPGDFE